MQLLTFTVAGQPYAIESRAVIEVLPLVQARPLSCMPDYVRGIFTYRGHLVPMIDLGRRLADHTLAERLSTRIMVVELRPLHLALQSDRAPTVRLGLIAENVISICSAEDADTSFPAMQLPDALFLGKILRINGQTVQLLIIEHLLAPALLAGVFPAAAEVPLS